MRFRAEILLQPAEYILAPSQTAQYYPAASEKYIDVVR
jgi:hypothetical protein